METNLVSAERQRNPALERRVRHSAASPSRQYAHSRSVSLPSIIKARLREIVAEGRLKATQWDDGRVISLVAAAEEAAASQCAQV